MNQLEKLIEKFSNKNPQCWKYPNSDMLTWARKQEQKDQIHGMGDLTEPCLPRPGETCPACEYQWPNK